MAFSLPAGVLPGSMQSIYLALEAISEAALPAGVAEGSGQSVFLALQDLALGVEGSNAYYRQLRAGRWFSPFPGTFGAGAVIPANTLRLLPLVIERATTITDLAIRVTVVAAGGNLRAAIYAADPTTGNPTGNPVAALAANITTANTGAVSGAIAGGSATLPPGLYWCAVMLDATGAVTTTLQTLAATSSYAGHLIGSDTLNDVTTAASIVAMCLSIANPGAYGTWPDLTAATFTKVTAQGSAVVFYKTAA
jgi:hypothetical protein